MDLGIIRSISQGGAICRFGSYEIAALSQGVPEPRIDFSIIGSISQGGAIRGFGSREIAALSQGVPELHPYSGILWCNGEISLVGLSRFVPASAVARPIAAGTQFL